MSNPTSRKLHAVTEIATAAVEPFRFINFAGTHAGPSDAVQGVSENAAVVGGAVSVVTGYSALVLAAVVIAAGDSVGPAADGSGRAVLGGAFLALGDAAAGELFETLLSSATQAPALAVLASTTGSLASADIATATGTPGQTIRIADGTDAGAVLVWAIPAGASEYAWCWWLWPQAAY